MKLTRSNGFTIIEIIIVVALFGLASVVFFSQKNQVETAARDELRRTSINAMYYSLEEVYFKEHKSYPRTVNEKILPSVDPSLFKDPSGVLIGEGNSDFRYEPSNCSEESCQKYTLRSRLENEDDYIKTNR